MFDPAVERRSIVPHVRRAMKHCDKRLLFANKMSPTTKFDTEAVSSQVSSPSAGAAILLAHVPMMVRPAIGTVWHRTIGVVESAWIPNIFPGTLITSKSKSELSKWPTAAARSHVPNAHDDS
jgi:hypothetical protein